MHGKTLILFSRAEKPSGHFCASGIFFQRQNGNGQSQSPRLNILPLKIWHVLHEEIAAVAAVVFGNEEHRMRCIAIAEFQETGREEALRKK